MATLGSETRDAPVRWTVLNFLAQVPSPPDALVRLLLPRVNTPEKVNAIPEAPGRSPAALPVKHTQCPAVAEEIVSPSGSEDEVYHEIPQVDQIDPPEPPLDVDANVAGNDGDNQAQSAHSHAGQQDKTKPTTMVDDSSSVCTVGEVTVQSPPVATCGQQHASSPSALDAEKLDSTLNAETKLEFSPTITPQPNSKAPNQLLDQDDLTSKQSTASPTVQEEYVPTEENSSIIVAPDSSSSTHIVAKNSWKVKDSSLANFLRRKSGLPCNIAEAEQSSVPIADARIFDEQIKRHLRGLLRHKTPGMRRQQDDRASCELVMMHYDSSKKATPVILFTCYHAERQKQIKAALQTPALTSALAKYGYPTVVQVDPTFGKRGGTEDAPPGSDDSQDEGLGGLPIYGYITTEATTLTGTLLKVDLHNDSATTTSLFCTAGGVISVADEYYGLTCSHAVARALRPSYDSMDEDEENEGTPGLPFDQTPKEIGKTGAVSLAISGGEPDFDWLLLKLQRIFLLPNEVTELWAEMTGSGTQGDTTSDASCTIRTSHGSVSGRVCAGLSMVDLGLASYDAARIELSEPIRHGDSGSWVYRQDKLFGIVIAGRDYPPTAYALLAREVFADISRQMGGPVTLESPAPTVTQDRNQHQLPQAIVDKTNRSQKKSRDYAFTRITRTNSADRLVPPEADKQRKALFWPPWTPSWNRTADQNARWDSSLTSNLSGSTAVGSEEPTFSKDYQRPSFDEYDTGDVYTFIRNDFDAPERWASERLHNSKHWATPKSKTLIDIAKVAVYILCALLPSMASSMILPLLKSIATDLGVESLLKSQLIFSAFFLGYIGGPGLLALTPRKHVVSLPFWIGMALFTGANFGCALANSLGVMVLFRILAGFGGGSLSYLLDLTLVSIGCTFTLSRMANTVRLAGSIIGPLLTLAVASLVPWRWSFHVTGLGSSALICLVLALKAGSHDHSSSATGLLQSKKANSWKSSRSGQEYAAMFRPSFMWHVLTQKPPAFLTTVGLAFIFGLYQLVLSTVSTISMHPDKDTVAPRRTATAMNFGVLGLTYTLSAIIPRVIARCIKGRWPRSQPIVSFRGSTLLPFLSTCILIVTSIVMLSTAAPSFEHPAVSTLALAMFASGTYSANAYASSYLRRMSATDVIGAMDLTIVLSSITGMVFPICAPLMYSTREHAMDGDPDQPAEDNSKTLSVSSYISIVLGGLCVLVAWVLFIIIFVRSRRKEHESKKMNSQPGKWPLQRKPLFGFNDDDHNDGPYIGATYPYASKPATKDYIPLLPLSGERNSTLLFR